MSFNILFLLSLLCAIGIVCGEKTPALIWSSSRPLGDLSQTYAGETLDGKVFTDDYLKPLTANNKHSLVVFMQDKLSVEDFTRHADVYSVNSDGGAFKNVKAAMDEQYSVHLPAVTSPKQAIEELSATFTGDVIRVDNSDSLGKTDLDKDKSYLIIVSLKPVSSKDEYGSFKENDAMIGKCLKHLNKRDVKYSAIYTAESSSQVASSERHGGRQLMATGDAGQDSNGTIWFSENVLLYLDTVNLTVQYKESADKKPTSVSLFFEYLEDTKTETSSVNDSISLDMTFDNDNGTMDLNIMLSPSEDGSMWKSSDGKLSFKGKQSAYDLYNVTNMSINYQIESFDSWCFHCSKLVTKPQLRGYIDAAKISVDLIFNKFQIQVSFNSTEDFAKNMTFSSDVWDCVEFFTIPIWMGIIITLIILTILFYGITMLANITTMDRFDDPKGKTISVTVNE